MIAVYVGSLLFGGLLIGASLLGGAHGADAHGGDGGGDVDGHGDAGDGHTTGAGAKLASLFGLRFWSFAAAFFGLTGLVMSRLGGAGGAPVVAAIVGVGAGLGASYAFRRLTRDTVGLVAAASELVGREGRLLLPVGPGVRGKIRVARPGGGHVDLLAESAEDAPLAADTDALIVEVRGNVALVARTLTGGAAKERA